MEEVSTGANSRNSFVGARIFFKMILSNLDTKFVKAKANQNGWDFEMEFLRLFAHGITHLADYNHKTESDEKKMLAKEEEILALFDLQKIQIFWV